MSDGRGRSSALAAARILGGAYLAITLTLIGIGLLMTHVLLHGAIGRWDDHVIAFALQQRSPGWTRISKDTTLIANTLGIVVVSALVTVVVFFWRRSRLALLLVLGLAVELAAFLSVNYAVQRPRPRVPHIGGTPSTYSWPSGHVAATFVLYGGIAVIVMKTTRRLLPIVLAWLLAAVLTTAVGISRVYEGEHHPTDVLAGLVLGLGALAGATHAVRAVRATRPSAGPARRQGLVPTS